MEIVYKIKTKELDNKIIETIKNMFVDEEVIISVISVKENKTKQIGHYSKKMTNALNNLENENYKEFSELEFEKLITELA